MQDVGQHGERQLAACTVSDKCHLCNDYISIGSNERLGRSVEVHFQDGIQLKVGGSALLRSASAGSGIFREAQVLILISQLLYILVTQMEGVSKLTVFHQYNRYVMAVFLKLLLQPSKQLDLSICKGQDEATTVGIEQNLLVG